MGCMNECLCVCVRACIKQILHKFIYRLCVRFIRHEICQNISRLLSFYVRRRGATKFIRVLSKMQNSTLFGVDLTVLAVDSHFDNINASKWRKSVCELRVFIKIVMRVCVRVWSIDVSMDAWIQWISNRENVRKNSVTLKRCYFIISLTSY